MYTICMQLFLCIMFCQVISVFRLGYNLAVLVGFDVIAPHWEKYERHIDTHARPNSLCRCFFGDRNLSPPPLPPVKFPPEGSHQEHSPHEYSGVRLGNHVGEGGGWTTCTRVEHSRGNFLRGVYLEPFFLY